MIIFDLDDTLIDSMHIWEEAVIYLFDKYSIDIAFEQAKARFISMTFNEVLQDLVDQYHLDFDTLNQDVSSYIYDQYANHIKEIPAALGFIKQCSREKISMVVVTSNELSLSKIVLERLGMLKYIQRIYSAPDLQLSKRDVDIYQKVLDDFNVQADEVVVYEDSVYAIRTAQRLGMECVGMINDYNCDEMQALNIPTRKNFLST